MLETKDLYMQMCQQSAIVHPMSKDELLRLQAHLRTMYLDIQKVCSKHNLKVMLAYGSVLGAIRHKGFIPWDDDLDLYMFRDDYERFIHLYAKDLPEHYILYAPNSANGPIARFAKVIDKNTEFIIPGSENCKNVQGVFVDIFPLDCVGKNKIINYIKKIIGWIVIYIAGSVQQYEAHSNEYKHLMSGNKAAYINYLIRRFLGFCFSFLPSQKWLNLCDKLFKMKNKSDFYACLAGDIHWKAVHVSCFLPMIKTTFDDIEAYIPNKSILYLKNIYGDWQKIPPLDSRWQHFVKRIKI